MQADNEIKSFIHGLNQSAFDLNKGMVDSGTTKDVPLQKDIYQDPPRQAPPPPAPPPSQISQAAPQQQMINIDPALFNKLIDRFASVEEHVNKFVTLIEKQVARNAKEINIRIKLDNASTNKE